VKLAVETGLPIVVHTREADEDVFRILARAGAGHVRGVFHCFSGSTAMARRAVDLGFYVSFSGIVTFPKAEAVRDAARVVPLNRLLVETDSPYLAPVPLRGRRNEPAWVVHVAAALAMVHDISCDALDETVTRNYRNLFGE
jgi:TatD DNase family protein